MTLRIGWFSTGRDEDAVRLLERVHGAILSGRLDASIEYVFCSRERGEYAASDRFLAVAAERGLTVLSLSSSGFRPELRKLDRERWRPIFDAEVLKLVEPYFVDVCLLAGYMLVVSGVLHDRCSMLNLHPAPPGGPVGAWQDVIWQVIARREREAGAMVNVVTAELDRGPAVAYCRFPIQGGGFASLWEALDAKLRAATLDEVRASEGETEPLFAAIRASEFKRETPLLLATLMMIAEGRVGFRDGAVLINGRPSKSGICVNEWVERLLAEEES